VATLGLDQSHLGKTLAEIRPHLHKMVRTNLRPCVRQNFPNFSFFFRKLRKNDVKLELRKSRKTRSDLKTDSKVRIKVRNAGPYTNQLKTKSERVSIHSLDLIQQVIIFSSISRGGTIGHL